MVTSGYLHIERQLIIALHYDVSLTAGDDGRAFNVVFGAPKRRHIGISQYLWYWKTQYIGAGKSIAPSCFSCGEQAVAKAGGFSCLSDSLRGKMEYMSLAGGGVDRRAWRAGKKKTSARPPASVWRLSWRRRCIATAIENSVRPYSVSSMASETYKLLSWRSIVNIRRSSLYLSGDIFIMSTSMCAPILRKPQCRAIHVKRKYFCNRRPFWHEKYMKGGTLRNKRAGGLDRNERYHRRRNERSFANHSVRMMKPISSIENGYQNNLVAA